MKMLSFSNLAYSVFYLTPFPIPHPKVSNFYPVQEALMNAMNDELPRIQEQVYYGNINSRTDVLDKFFSESGISRYNPQVKSYSAV